jgi:hypothetical protein
MNFVYWSQQTTIISRCLRIGDAEFCVDLKVSRTVYSLSSLTLALCNYTVSAQLRPAGSTLVVVVTKCAIVVSVTAPTSPPLLFCFYIAKRNLCAIWRNTMQINFPLVDRSVSLCSIIITFFMLKQKKIIGLREPEMFPDFITHGPDCQRAN